MRVATVIFCVITIFVTGCTSQHKTPDLGGLYNALVQNESPYRNPVILTAGMKINQNDLSLPSIGIRYCFFSLITWI